MTITQRANSVPSTMITGSHFCPGIKKAQILYYIILYFCQSKIRKQTTSHILCKFAKKKSNFTEGVNFKDSLNSS